MCKNMKVLIAGASGFIGKALAARLLSSGHEVIRLVRDPTKRAADAVYWNPTTIDETALHRHAIDAVVNLAGASIVQGRWTRKRKEEILNSRVLATRVLTEQITNLQHPPHVFVNGSAIGYYGNHGETICTETTPSGEGFLADVCRQWEAATEPAAKKGIRTVCLRTGIVLSPNGGALGKMLPPFKLGLGGRIGSGNQYMSWIALDELISIILYILTHTDIKGPVNATAPYSVTNAEFTHTLAQTLHRPAFFTIPVALARFAFGKEKADECLLSSTRVIPKKLIQHGYIFQHPHLAEALKTMLKS